jgi:heme/copper-type cytochrome/quinol oxidase subunit 3
VVAGVVSGLAVVAAAWGRRNRAGPTLFASWALIFVAFVVETGNGDAGGEALLGLELAMWATLLLTVAAVLTFLAVAAERRRRAVAEGARPA